jgi:hypothetical protein
VTVAQKVVLYDEDSADPNGKRFVGSMISRTEIGRVGLNSAHHSVMMRMSVVPVKAPHARSRSLGARFFIG